MKRRIFRWGIYFCGALLLLLIVGALSVDALARLGTERNLRSKTGFEVKLRKMTVGLAAPTITLQDLKIYNPPEFGGGEFISIPELHLEYDFAELRNGRLHFRLIRLNAAEFNVVESKAGKRNTDLLQSHLERHGKKRSKNTARGEDLDFTGIDTLQVTIGRTRFISLRRSQLNTEHSLGLKNEVYSNIRTEKEIQAVLIAMSLKAGLNVLFEDYFGKPKDVVPGVQDNLNGDAGGGPRLEKKNDDH